MMGVEFVRFYVAQVSSPDPFDDPADLQESIDEIAAIHKQHTEEAEQPIELNAFQESKREKTTAANVEKGIQKHTVEEGKIVDTAKILNQFEKLKSLYRDVQTTAGDEHRQRWREEARRAIRNFFQRNGVLFIQFEDELTAGIARDIDTLLWIFQPLET